MKSKLAYDTLDVFVTLVIDMNIVQSYYKNNCKDISAILSVNLAVDWPLMWCY